MPTPIGPGDGIVTASVAVNNCAATYVRSAPSMNASGVALVPAGSGPFYVYSTPLVAGDWGVSSGPYTTCDGSGDMWYELASGPNRGDYFPSGGVHATATTTYSWACSESSGSDISPWQTANACVDQGDVFTVPAWGVGDTLRITITVTSGPAALRPWFWYSPLQGSDWYAGRFCSWDTGTTGVYVCDARGADAADADALRAAGIHYDFSSGGIPAPGSHFLAGFASDAYWHSSAAGTISFSVIPGATGGP
jgi:hypothetical protein